MRIGILGSGLMGGNLVYCGDDADAKAVAAVLIRDVGFDPVDAGRLKVAGYTEPFTLLVAGARVRGRRRAGAGVPVRALRGAGLTPGGGRPSDLPGQRTRGSSAAARASAATAIRSGRAVLPEDDRVPSRLSHADLVRPIERLAPGHHDVRPLDRPLDGGDVGHHDVQGGAPAGASASAGMSFRTLARLWYITSIPSFWRITKPSRSPSGTSAIRVKPRRSTQKERQGSIASTTRTGDSLLSLTTGTLTSADKTVRYAPAVGDGHALR